MNLVAARQSARAAIEADSNEAAGWAQLGAVEAHYATNFAEEAVGGPSFAVEAMWVRRRAAGAGRS